MISPKYPFLLKFTYQCCKIYCANKLSLCHFFICRREELHDDVFAKITEARGEAVRAITKLKQRNNMIVGKLLLYVQTCKSLNVHSVVKYCGCDRRCPISDTSAQPICKTTDSPCFGLRMVLHLGSCIRSPRKN